jgi:hypothetical protein
LRVAKKKKGKYEEVDNSSDEEGEEEKIDAS